MKINLRHWHTMRIIRLLFGIFLIFQAIDTREWFFFLFAAFFLFQAFANQGCGINTCELPQKDATNE